MKNQRFPMQLCVCSADSTSSVHFYLYYLNVSIAGNTFVHCSIYAYFYCCEFTDGLQLGTF